MEKSNQKEMEYMKPNKEPWIDTRLSQKAMDFLWGCISEENKEDHSGQLAGNISKSETIIDKDNWFFENVLKKCTERMFYDDWDNYRKYHIVKEHPLPKFEMDRFWVNYQKQHEFNPLHFHSGGNGYSFVIFVKIPTHWKEQHALPISTDSTVPSASDFQFVWSEKDSEVCRIRNFLLSPEDNGRMLFFPAWLNHMVYPFYECEEERVTISGNIRLYDSNRPKEREIPVGEGAVVAMSSQELQVYYEEKEKMLKMMENRVKVTKEELKSLKKAGEKEG
jgi:hypothetical protein